MMSTRAYFVLPAFTLAAMGGCADQLDAPAPASLRMAPIAPCTQNENNDRQFPSGADRIVVEVRGGAIPASEDRVWTIPRADGTAAGEVVVAGVPPGEGMSVRVVGCSQTETLWAGVARDVAVTEHTKSFPPIFMTPVGSVACTGSAETVGGGADLGEARAFAALAASAEEAWALGGFSGYNSATATATATASVDRYARITGEFTDAGALTEARGMALAQRRSDGTIRVVGGSKSIQLARPGVPPIWASDQDAPAAGSEIYDPATGTSTAEGALGAVPTLPSLAALGSGKVLAVGGIGAGTGSSAITPFVGWISDGGSDSSTQDAATRRFGATIVPIADEVALIWGGHPSGLAADIGAVVRTDQALSGGVQSLTVNGTDVMPIFASGALVSSGGGAAQILIAGGSRIEAGQGGPVFPRDVASPRLQLVRLDVQGATANVSDIDITGLEGAFTRAAATLVPLANGEFFWFGGYTAFTGNPICGTQNDCLQADMVRFAVDGGAASVRGSVLEAAVGPFGAALVPLSDGAHLMTGGLETITQAELDTAASLLRFEAFERDLCGEFLFPEG